MTIITTETVPYVIVRQDEFDFLKWYDQLTTDDVMEIAEHKDVFKKYLAIRLRQIDLDLMNFKYVDKEKEAYNSMKTLSALSEWIDKQIEELHKMVKEHEEANLDPIKEKDKLEKKAIEKMKKKYKI